jgi:hypothetical protein
MSLVLISKAPLQTVDFTWSKRERRGPELNGSISSSPDPPSFWQTHAVVARIYPKTQTAIVSDGSMDGRSSMLPLATTIVTNLTWGIFIKNFLTPTICDFIRDFFRRFICGFFRQILERVTLNREPQLFAVFSLGLECTTNAAGRKLEAMSP